MPGETEGPYVSMAVLCEKVLQEGDGVLSVIRVVDRLILSPGPGAPEKMPPVPINMPAVISIKSGMLTGQFTIRLTVQMPDGQEKDVGTFPVLLEGADRGHNFIVNLVFQAEEQGLYWFGVYLEAQLLTRMPLRVIYQRIGLGSFGRSQTTDT
jgi:hypothetical protein